MITCYCHSASGYLLASFTFTGKRRAQFAQRWAELYARALLSAAITLVEE